MLSPVSIHWLIRFLSTRSARRATCAPTAEYLILEHFYPRPPRGGRHGHVYPSLLRANFYPRPPRGGRPRVVAVVADPYLFLSTPSARRATDALPTLSTAWMISIHALREEGDRLLLAGTGKHRNFYPRPPRGGRLTGSARKRSKSQFLSTPSARRATVTQRTNAEWKTYFYPRPPRGGRPAVFVRVLVVVLISIHALREEGDQTGQGLRGA